MHIKPKYRTIPLGHKRLSAHVGGEVVINIEINGKEYRGVVAEVIDNLCADVIFGTDPLMKHRQIIFNYNGPKGDLIIGAIPQQNDSPALSTVNNTENPSTLPTSQPDASPSVPPQEIRYCQYITSTSVH